MYNDRERVGRMRERVQFLQPLLGRGDYGEETQTWVASNEVWASFDYQTASDEKEIANRNTAMRMVEVTTRLYDDVNEKMRLFHRQDEYEIVSIRPSDKRQYMTMEVVKSSEKGYRTVKDASGNNWIDPLGNEWVIMDQTSDTQTNSTGLSWTDGTGHVWAALYTID